LWWELAARARGKCSKLLDLQAWRESDHNPLRMLAAVAAGNSSKSSKAIPEFLKRYDAVMEEFEANMRRRPAGSRRSTAILRRPSPTFRRSTHSTIRCGFMPEAWEFWREITLKNAATWQFPWLRWD